jgi:hypothetical protein
LSTGYSAGNSAFVLIQLGTSTTVNSITDSSGNTYTLTKQGASNVGQIALFAAKNLIAGGSTLTVTLAGAQPDCAILVSEYSGSTNTGDVSLTATGATTSASIGPTGTTANAVELVLAGFSAIDTSGFPSFTTPTGYTARNSVSVSFAGNLYTVALFEHITSSTGTQSAASTITSGGTFGGWGAVIAALLPPTIVPSVRVPDTPTLPTLPSLNL